MSPPAVRSPTDLIKDHMEALQIRGAARPLDRAAGGCRHIRFERAAEPARKGHVPALQTEKQWRTIESGRFPYSAGQVHLQAASDSREFADN
jgi:hypothetical protein